MAAIDLRGAQAGDAERKKRGKRLARASRAGAGAAEGRVEFMTAVWKTGAAATIIAVAVVDGRHRPRRSRREAILGRRRSRPSPSASPGNRPSQARCGISSIEECRRVREHRSSKGTRPGRTERKIALSAAAAPGAHVVDGVQCEGRGAVAFRANGAIGTPTQRKVRICKTNRRDAAKSSDAKPPAVAQTPLAREIARRRTFAIISHPDAGKTTLTEKLLLFGGAIQLAGQVKAKRGGRRTRSDWMAIEKARGISVVTSVMTFEYGGAVFNLLDTPGHEDFSDHTYRTLTAVDSRHHGDRRGQGHRGAHAQAVRDLPPARHPHHHLHQQDGPREPRAAGAARRDREDAGAATRRRWSGRSARGADFKGTYDLANPRIRQIDEEPRGIAVSGPDDPRIDKLLDAGRGGGVARRDLAGRAACGKLRPGEVPRRHADAGVLRQRAAEFRRARPARRADRVCAAAAQPEGRRRARSRPPSARMTGIVFKIQANMDPNHRDRIAFMRVCSGKLTRGMKVKVVRTGKTMALTAPQFFFAQDRSIAEEAFAGDVVGIPNRGTLRIGDALTEGEDMTFLGIPSFAPEILRRIRLGGRDQGAQAARTRCTRWRRRAWCSCSRRSTARSPSSASSARCSSTCWPTG